jgi:hypothetical protein
LASWQKFQHVLFAAVVIKGFPKFFHFIEVGTDEAEQLPLYV